MADIEKKHFVAPNVTQRTWIEHGHLVGEQIFHDDRNLERNKQLRNSGYLDKSKLDLHDNEDIRMYISVPTTAQWSMFKKKYPDVYKDLMSMDEQTRMSGAKRLQLLHPEWVVMERL